MDLLTSAIFAKTSEFSQLHILCVLCHKLHELQAQGLWQTRHSVSCIVETEKTEGTEMLLILLSWVPDFIPVQIQGQLHRTGICASVKSLGLDMSNTLECLLLIYCYKRALRMSAIFMISVGAPSRPPQKLQGNNKVSNELFSSAI